MTNPTPSPWQKAQDAIRVKATAMLGHEVELKQPPDPSLGDIAIPCFDKVANNLGETATC